MMTRMVERCLGPMNITLVYKTVHPAYLPSPSPVQAISVDLAVVRYRE